ncbi:TPA: hypothetical protein ACH3X2_009258 [Trebouxia sp. C0005]
MVQSFHSCSNLHTTDNINITNPEVVGAVLQLQASSYGARKVLGTLPAAATTSLIQIVKQDGVNKHPNRTSSYVVPRFKLLKDLRWHSPCRGDSPNLSSNVALHRTCCA